MHLYRPGQINLNYSLQYHWFFSQARASNIMWECYSSLATALLPRGFRLDNVLFHSDSTGRRPTCKTNRIHDEMWRFRDDAQGQQDVSECHKSPRFEYLKLIWYKLSSYVIIMSVRLTEYHLPVHLYFCLRFKDALFHRVTALFND